MNGRIKAFFVIFALALACAGAGCGYNQPSRFQMSFLPPAPHGASPAVHLPEPPVTGSNPYLRDVPPFLATEPPVPRRVTQSDDNIRRADRRFQAGKRAYQIKDLGAARREFDGAIDLMLQASSQDPSDRQELERKLDEMVDAIHRYDLAD